MAQKKLLTVDLIRKGKRRWSLSMDGSDLQFLQDVADAILASAKKHGVIITNAANPFGKIVLPKKREPKKANSKSTQTAVDPIDPDTKGTLLSVG